VSSRIGRDVVLRVANGMLWQTQLGYTNDRYLLQSIIIKNINNVTVLNIFDYRPTSKYHKQEYRTMKTKAYS
jgi:hypothetical protein